MLFKLSYLTRISKTINQIIFVNQFKNESHLELFFEEFPTCKIQYIHSKIPNHGDIDDGDGNWRRNGLMTTSRSWPFSIVLAILVIHIHYLFRCQRCHQLQVINIKILPTSLSTFLSYFDRILIWLM